MPAQALAEAPAPLVEGNAARHPTVVAPKGIQQIMPDQNEKQPPPATLSGDPERELEQKLRRDPDDKDAKVDVGSDESMDASDPPSSSQPGSGGEPVPSSGFPGKK
jgi:hypothetical protein